MVPFKWLAKKQELTCKTLGPLVHKSQGIIIIAFNGRYWHVNGDVTSQEAVHTYALSMGHNWDSFLSLIGARVALLHAIAGVLIPLILVPFLTRFFCKNKIFREGLAVWKFALFASLSMVIPYLIVARTLGPEFPSLFGSLVGLAIVTTAARRGFLMPKKETHWEFDPKENWDPKWIGTIEIATDDEKKTMSLGKAWAPYLLVVVLLFVTRLKALPFAGWLTSGTMTMTWENLFGTGIGAAFQPLYLPGAIFILVSVITYFLHRIDWACYKRAWASSLKTAVAASMALVFTVPMEEKRNHNGDFTGMFS